MAAVRRRSKYNAKPVVRDGVRFASTAESKRDAELAILQKAGQIKALKRQPQFDLVVNGDLICRYRADWQYVENGDVIVEDLKGVLTPSFRIKWALAKALHPEIEWRLS